MNDARVNRLANMNDPPIRNGQIKMPTQRCTADNKQGGRCGAKTQFGEHCWRHLSEHDKLRIKKVGPPVNGKGIFASTFIPKKTKWQYTGDINLNAHPDDPDTGSDYVPPPLTSLWNSLMNSSLSITNSGRSLTALSA